MRSANSSARRRANSSWAMHSTCDERNRPDDRGEPAGGSASTRSALGVCPGLVLTKRCRCAHSTPLNLKSKRQMTTPKVERTTHRERRLSVRVHLPARRAGELAQGNPSPHLPCPQMVGEATGFRVSRRPVGQRAPATRRISGRASTDRHDFAGVSVLDPFMGSGTTIGEAHKMGFTSSAETSTRSLSPPSALPWGPWTGTSHRRRIRGAIRGVGERIRRSTDQGL